MLQQVIFPEGTATCGEPMVGQVYPEGLQPTERTHAAAGNRGGELLLWTDRDLHCPSLCRTEKDIEQSRMKNNEETKLNLGRSEGVARSV